MIKSEIAVGSANRATAANHRIVFMYIQCGKNSWSGKGFFSVTLVHSDKSPPVV